MTSLETKLEQLRRDYRRYPSKRSTILLQARVLQLGLSLVDKPKSVNTEAHNTQLEADSQRLVADVKKYLF